MPSPSPFVKYDMNTGPGKTRQNCGLWQYTADACNYGSSPRNKSHLPSSEECYRCVFCRLFLFVFLVVYAIFVVSRRLFDSSSLRVYRCLLRSVLEADTPGLLGIFTLGI